MLLFFHGGSKSLKISLWACLKSIDVLNQQQSIYPASGTMCLTLDSITRSTRPWKNYEFHLSWKKNLLYKEEIALYCCVRTPFPKSKLPPFFFRQIESSCLFTNIILSAVALISPVISNQWLSQSPFVIFSLLWIRFHPP